MKYKMDGRYETPINYSTDNDIDPLHADSDDHVDNDFLMCYHLGKFIYHFHLETDKSLDIVGDADLYFYILGWSMMNG